MSQLPVLLANRASSGMALLAILFSVAGCGRPTPDVEEVFRTGSPDQLVDAVITTVSVDATTDASYEVHIVPKGTNKFDDPVFRADKTDSLSVSWQDNNRLVIRCHIARIFHFSNFWESAAVMNPARKIAIEMSGCNYQLPKESGSRSVLRIAVIRPSFGGKLTTHLDDPRNKQ